MIKQQLPSRDARRQIFLKYAEESRQGLASGKFLQVVFAHLVDEECYVALYSDDPAEVREHFRKAAEAAKELFRIAWENRDNFRKGKVTGDDGSSTSCGATITGIHAALAAGDLELARNIAEHSGFKDDPWFFGKRATLYATALRNWVLTGDFSGFSQVSPEDKWLGWYVFAKLFLMAKDNPSQALADLETLDQKFQKSRLRDELTFRVILASLRNWLKVQLRP